MPTKFTFREIARLIELNKEKAELQFKLDYASSNSASKDQIKALQDLLAKVSDSVKSIHSMMQNHNVEFILPNEGQINEYSAELAKSEHAAIVSAIRSKEGSVYDLMSKRAAITKRNYENRENIGKLLILLSKIKSKNKPLAGEIAKSMRLGSFDMSAIANDSLDNKQASYLSRFLVRVGITKSEDIIGEICMNINNRIVWVNKEASDKLLSNSDKMKALSNKIQLKNAERQVKVFNDQEEKDYSELQHEYLKLLKEQDELLKDFNEEENIFSFTA